MPAQTKDVPPPKDPPPMEAVGPGGPQPGHYMTFSYQMSQALIQIAAAQYYGPLPSPAEPQTTSLAELFPYK
jgi:hypothetical protein